MNWILDNGKWLIQLSADLLITIGTLTFAVFAYKQTRLQWKNNRPQIDIQLKLTEEDKLALKIKNVGELSVTGSIYLLVEPKINNQQSDIIPRQNYQPLQNKEKFNQYFFAKLDFRLGANEAPCIYDPLPIEDYLTEQIGKEKITNFIRLESCYQNINYGNQKLNFTKYYKLTPDQKRWSLSKVNVDTKFTTNDYQEELPTYQDYKKDILD